MKKNKFSILGMLAMVLLGLVFAGCESAPPAPVAQTFEGPVIRSYEGDNLVGKPGTYIVVDTDGNLETTADQKHIFISPKYVTDHPQVLNADSVRFNWYPAHSRAGIGECDYITLINGEVVHTR
jgi:hypothetical protein